MLISNSAAAWDQEGATIWEFRAATLLFLEDTAFVFVGDGGWPLLCFRFAAKNDTDR